jgi:hypothetical protein
MLIQQEGASQTLQSTIATSNQWESVLELSDGDAFIQVPPRQSIPADRFARSASLNFTYRNNTRGSLCPLISATSGSVGNLKTTEH